jgi:uncharacterized protein (UPF0147 family)
MTVLKQAEKLAAELKESGSELAEFVQSVVDQLVNVQTDTQAANTIRRMLSVNKSNLALVKDEYQAMRIRAQNHVLETIIADPVTEHEIKIALREQFGITHLPQRTEIVRWCESRWGDRVDAQLVCQAVSELCGD